MNEQIPGACTGRGFPTRPDRAENGIRSVKRVPYRPSRGNLPPAWHEAAERPGRHRLETERSDARVCAIPRGFAQSRQRELTQTSALLHRRLNKGCIYSIRENDVARERDIRTASPLSSPRDRGQAKIEKMTDDEETGGLAAMAVGRTRAAPIQRFIVVFLLSLFLVPPCYAQERQVLFREDFTGLDGWRPLFFPNVRKHTMYAIDAKEGECCLKAESNGAASALVYKGEFNAYEFPWVRWRWKVENVYQKGDPEKRSGDDYPIRVQIVFKYDPEKAGRLKRMEYALARKIYGEYPPQSTLSYVWANREDQKAIMASPFSNSIRLLALQKGDKKSGTWCEEEVNIVRDYREAFGVDPPSIAGIVIMNDSDDTGERSVSYVKSIEVFRNTR